MATLKIWGKEFPTDKNIDFKNKLNTNRTFEFVVCVEEKHLQIFPEKPKGIKILEVEKVSDAYYIRLKSVRIENGLNFIEKVAFERGYYYGLSDLKPLKNAK